MLPESQARLLRLLARYPDELVEAWDVPRELSLPGLSESLGLVRIWSVLVQVFGRGPVY